MTTTQRIKHSVRWGSLCMGDFIVCPLDGALELVTRTARYGDESRMIKTTRHDHIRLCSKKIDRRP